MEEEGAKLILFAKWLAMNYSDVMNTEEGDWYATQLDNFNKVVYPNYIKNGSVKDHIKYLKRRSRTLGKIKEDKNRIDYNNLPF